FSAIYSENETLLKAGENIWVKGQVEVNEEGAKLMLSKKSHAKILPLRHAYEAMAKELHLHFPLNGSTALKPETLNKLQNYLQAVNDKNGSPLFLHLETSKRAETVLRMKQTIPLNRDTVNFIKNILQEERMRLEFR
ncbi:MAG: hypothetical protein ACKOA8_19680, partial [Deltaproteobacteria bacterium]